MIAIATPGAGLIEALERIAAMPGAIFALVLLAALVVGTIALVRGAMR